MGIRSNHNYLTDKEFENFLENIGGVVINLNGDLKTIKERKYFSIKNGRLGILQRLFETLIALGWNREFISVKEKFGGMSVFLGNVPENGFYFILGSEKESFESCELCGESGKNQRIGGWFYTVCEEHKKEYEGKNKDK